MMERNRLKVLSDYELEQLTSQVIEIYNQMEMELLIDIAHRFSNYSSVSGSLEWKIKKLEELGLLNQNSIEIIAKYSNRSEEAIRKMLEESIFGNIDEKELNRAFNNGLISVSPEVMMQSVAIKATLENSFLALGERFKLINTNAVESAKQGYLDILNKSYVEVSSGIYSYNEAIERGIKEMAQSGIKGATYIKNGKVVKHSIEAVVRRDTLTAVNQTANRAAIVSAQEMGANHVEVSSHIGARVSDRSEIANHAGWQGKVYLIDGKDDEFDNLYEKTGYGEVEGLSGVNCRHRMFAFFPDISKPEVKTFTEEENEKHFKLTQRQRALERRVRRWKKESVMMKAFESPEGYAEAKANHRKAVDELIKFVDENGLKRDGLRELIQE